MRLTELLEEEHKSIKLMLRILDKVCEKLESGEGVNPEHLEEIIEFIKVFADKCHHGKEEDLLFVAMSKAGIPTSVMLEEHGMGRDYVRGMSEAVDSYKKGDSRATPNIVKNARGYIKLLTKHIEKEDKFLFPAAEKRIPAGKKKELLEDFERVEQERIGPGKHEEFHRLLHDLKTAYLK